jgi:hypothetical protein
MIDLIKALLGDYLVIPGHDLFVGFLTGILLSSLYVVRV